MEKTENEVSLDELPTESIEERFRNVDELAIEDALELINEEDASGIDAVGEAVPDIANGVEIAHDRLKGRPEASVVYVGTGTSGRLGAVDAAEWQPTFGVPENRAKAIIAGGQAALTSAVENVEDNTDRARERIRSEVDAQDVVFGISASGRTPYTVAALEEASSLGAATISFSCNPEAPLAGPSDVDITAQTGPEVISGSTRMKAGLATKAVLTMFSTALMIQLGHVEGNIMIDLDPANSKLRKRAIRIVIQLTDLTDEEAKEALIDHDWDVRSVINDIG